jgi:hypothetical protein
VRGGYARAELRADLAKAQEAAEARTAKAQEAAEARSAKAHTELGEDLRGVIRFSEVRL